MRWGGNAAWHLSASYWVWTEPPRHCCGRKWEPGSAQSSLHNSFSSTENPQMSAAWRAAGTRQFSGNSTFPICGSRFRLWPVRSSIWQTCDHSTHIYVYHDCISVLTDIHVFLAIELPKISFKLSNLLKKYCCVCALRPFHWYSHDSMLN